MGAPTTRRGTSQVSHCVSVTVCVCVRGWVNESFCLTNFAVVNILSTLCGIFILYENVLKKKVNIDVF